LRGDRVSHDRLISSKVQPEAAIPKIAAFAFGEGNEGGKFEKEASRATHRAARPDSSPSKERLAQDDNRIALLLRNSGENR
jgi:hypothetical protein